jgi:hypothetical protein
VKKAAWILLLFCFGCSRTEKVPAIHILLINNKQSVKITGLNVAVMNEIARDSSNEIWQSLIPVYRMPADTDMKDYQPVQPGKYLRTDSALVFTPDTPFVQGKTYFLRFYQFAEGSGINDFIKGRKRLGQTRYTDLIFK